MDIQTLCIHGNDERYDRTGAISVPIYQSATFAHKGVGLSTGFDYSRDSNPTREHLEKTVAKLENGSDAMAFSSGMAAITAIMELFSSSDHIIASDDLYGGSYRLFFSLCVKHGLEFSLVNTNDIGQIEQHIKPNTKALYIETPSNPLMHVTDIEEAARLSRSRSLLLIVDNTFLTPYFQKPLELGADIVVHSGTKYLCGHNDTLAGFVVVKDSEYSDRLRYIYKTTGACLSPFDSWLIIRGIKTLAVRMERQQENALEIASWLRKQKIIKSVHYVGLVDHPEYEISRRQSTGFGSMISFEVQDEETAIHILEHVSVISFAESLGGVESLITYPLLQTHADVPKDQREAMGINSSFLRLSVGLEAAEDLISDLERAMEGR